MTWGLIIDGNKDLCICCKWSAGEPKPNKAQDCPSIILATSGSTGARLHPHKVHRECTLEQSNAEDRHTTFTQKSRIEINMFLDDGRKPEYLEKT